MKKNIAYIAQQITDQCLQKRDNAKNRSFAGLQKSRGIVKILNDAGYGVHVYSPSIISNGKGSMHKAFFENAGSYDIFHAAAIDLPFFNYLSSRISLIRQLIKDRKKLDRVVYYNYSLESAVPAFFCKVFLRKPIYLEYEDGLDQNSGFKGFVFKILKLFALLLSSGYILVNEKLLKNVKGKPSLFCPGVFDWDLLQREAHSKRGDKTIITYTGKLSSYFGLNELLVYMGNINKESELHIAGYYWKSDIDLEKYIKEHKYKNVFYHGMLEKEELQKLFDKTDFFLLLNEKDSMYSDTNFPSKLFVYLSCLKPVITTKKLEIDGINKKKCIIELKKAEDIVFFTKKELKSVKKSDIIEYHDGLVESFKELLD